MLFNSIVALMAQTQSKIINFSVSANGPLLTVTIIPDVKSGNGILRPLCITGTAQELDSGIVEALKSYSDVRTSLSEQIEETNKQLKLDAGEVMKSLTSKSKAKNDTAPQAKTEQSPEPLGEDDAENESNNSEKVVTKSEVSGNIFTMTNGD